MRSNFLLAGARQVISGSPIIKAGHAIPFLLEPLQALAIYETELVPELDLSGEARAEALLQNEHGKPFFEHGPEFCLSHSGFYAVLAAGEAPLGVDLEAPAAYRSRIAMRCFTPEERVFAESRENGFCLVWTKKEAVMKAAGVGFALSPASFSVLENPCAAGGSRYHLAGAEYDGYAVALASKEEIGEIRFRLISAEELLRGG
ncbi:MAG TPA: 4'-phosphopantetheinyl transferase superfamily protein [Oscillospiraceae bacterium]|nr:4'-phosphopantetheinyl transferase superfamily protein [Oscillospiraceae bacterium]